MHLGLVHEQELKVVRGEPIDSCIIVINSSVNHVRFLILQLDNFQLYTVLNTESCDSNRSFLSNSVYSVHRLPLHTWVPPWVHQEHL